jgi:osmotically-inducible protein OsmY
MPFAKGSWLLWIFLGLAVATAAFGLLRRRIRSSTAHDNSQLAKASTDLGGYDLPSVATRKERAPQAEEPSDHSIACEINERLRAEDTFDDTAMIVAVRTGRVTLTGTVRTDYQRGRAAALAATVDGVIDVRSALQLTDA